VKRIKGESTLAKLQKLRAVAEGQTTSSFTCRREGEHPCKNLGIPVPGTDEVKAVEIETTRRDESREKG